MMKKSQIKSRAIALHESGITNKLEIARIICRENNAELSDSVRLMVNRAIRKHIGSVKELDEDDSGKSSWDESDGSAIFEYKGERSIKTLDDALKFCEVDLNTWEVDRHVFNSWDVSMKGKDGIPFKRTNYQVKVWFRRVSKTYDKFKEDLISEISKWSPKYRGIPRVKSNDPHCLVFSPADIHIGKLCSSFETGEDYNQQIAVQRVREGLQGILKKSNGFDIDRIIFIAGNDILHTDTPRRTTTSGTPQDTDGMWYDNFITAKKLLVEIIETLVSVADVEVHYCPSNHDYMSGFMLFDSVSAWFRRHSQVTFYGNVSHRKYTTYGKNLIGMTHMDGAKVADLPLLMAHEAPQWWAECNHRYIFGHHVHHKTSKDYMSVCVETLRSPSGTDSWHHRNGYQHAPAAIEAFVHHEEHGQVARLTHIF